MKNKILISLFLFSLFYTLPACAEEEWQENKGRHFIIYYQKAPKDFVNTVEKMAENYYEEISRNLGFVRYKGWTWEQRAKIYIYNDKEHYINDAKFYKWSSGIASTRKKIIRTFPSAHGFFDSTLPHELGHIIFREFVGYKARIPLWFEEGVAMYQEKAKRWGADSVVKKAIEDGGFIPIEELMYVELSSRTDRKVITIFYAEAASLVHFIINEYGQRRFVRLCRELQKGGPFDWAFKKIYVRFPTMNKLNDSWVYNLKNK